MADVAPLSPPGVASTRSAHLASLIQRLEGHLAAAAERNARHAGERHRRTREQWRDGLASLTSSLEAELPAVRQQQARAREQASQLFAESEAQLDEAGRPTPQPGPVLPVALALLGSGALL